MSASSFERFTIAFAGYFELDPAQLDTTTRLSEDLGLDSVALYEVVLLLEDVAGHAIPDELAAELCTLGDVHHYYELYDGRAPQ